KFERACPQLLVWVKSPVMVIAEICAHPRTKRFACWGPLDSPTSRVPKSKAPGNKSPTPVAFRLNSYAPMSTIPAQVDAFPGPMRPLPSKSLSGRLGAELVPASIAGDELCK